MSIEAPFALGDVVCCYPDGPHPSYGVVVVLPTEGYPRYRVRIVTRSPTDFDEMGVAAEHLKKVAGSLQAPR